MKKDKPLTLIILGVVLSGAAVGLNEGHLDGSAINLFAIILPGPSVSRRGNVLHPVLGN
ncbi:hypothetical protein [Arthrobacter sedimenti]|uniref:hypothetical protein n=1 Tax=Arthrobacter sedimenti TaxID=2694931 RepID=UPI00142E53A6|nr:hypothetical protein [Arthrobacter sedimenti]